MTTPLERDEDLLLQVAGTISDGKPVDWEEAGSDPGLTETRLRPLRLVEAIVQAHRAVSSSDPTVSGGTGQGRETQTIVRLIDDDLHGRPLDRWGRLTDLRLMARGSFGEVYRAHDPNLQREVALKLPRSDRSDRAESVGARDFLREARLLARVRHPNVMVVHGADLIDGQVGIWTDIVEGKTLEACLREQGPFSADEATLIGIDLCGALAAVHGAGLVHRDVKTANVMRARGGRILLVDFGAASGKPAAGASASADPLAGGGERAGTMIAMAPEVLVHGQPAGPAADIYGLGVILYRLVSGRFPVEADGSQDLIEKHRLGMRTPLRDARPDLPPAFVQVVERALAADPAQRYASAGAMEQALASALPSIRPDADRSRRRGRFSWLATAAVATAILALGLSLWHVWPGGFRAEASFFRVTEAGLEPLVSGARVRPGDHLGLEIHGSEPLYAYVLNEDAQGEMFVLFPAGLDLANPLPPRSRVRLPGRLAGKSIDWVVTTAHGAETIVAFLSRQPVAQIEELLASLPRASAEAGPFYPSIPRDSIPRLFRGIGGLAPSPSTPDVTGPGRLSHLLRQLPSEPGEAAIAADSLWVRRLELENPGP